MKNFNLLAIIVSVMSITFSLCAGTFDVTAFGAKADDATDNTAAIQKAIDACSAKGGGRVLVPSGGVYQTYTLNLKNNVELHIERGATLKGGEGPYKYPEFKPTPVWNVERAPRFNRRAMFYTVGQTNVAITGAGTIDGNAEKFHERTDKRNWTGYNWWRKSDTNITGRCVFFVGCSDVRLDDVLIYHTSGWSTWFLDCDRIGIRGVRIEADHRFPNGDGLHFGGCRDVTVSDCMIDSQDDSLIIRTHQEQMKKPRPCERVVVNNCILRSSGAYVIRIGFTGDGPVRDMSFNNIISPHSRLGIGFTLPPEPAPPNEYKDPPRGRGLVPPPLSSRLPFYAENLRFSNMSIICDQAPLGVIVGNTERVSFMKDITFSNCSFKSQKPPFCRCRSKDNVRNWRFSDVTFEIVNRPPLGINPNEPKPEDFFKNVSNFEFYNVKYAFTGEPLLWQLVLEKDGVQGAIPIEGADQKYSASEDATRPGVRRYVYDSLKAGTNTYAIKMTIEERTTPTG
ncbi:MAG: hypothetical protein IKR48_01450, partial [Kiritimatiellae bacterium]|nr:hypothetical protein [Kiritimatiellia bacterium]